MRFIEVGGEELAVLTYTVTEPRLPKGLTEVERDVVRAVLNGQSNRDIANARGRAVRTIANQLASIFRKLAVRSRNELVAKLTSLAE